MTDCENGDIRDLLPDLLHGRLDRRQRAGVEAHVAACADCREELALLHTMRRALAAAPAIDVARVVGALPPTRDTARRRSRGWHDAAWRRAAAVALLTVGGLGLAVTRPWAPSSSPPAPVASGGASPAVAVAPGRAGASGESEVTGDDVFLLAAGIADLTEEELTSVLREFETADGVPSAEPEPMIPVPLAAVGEGA